MKRLVLIDGHAIIHRAYHAYPKLNARDGRIVNAVYGFTAILLKTIDDLKPEYLAVAFDLPIPTFRKELYMAYQATRAHGDDDLNSQFPLVEEVVRAAGIPVFTAPGFEADDAIGTIAKQATANHLVDEAVIVTGDRDMMQLVNHKVKLLMPQKGLSEVKLVDAEGVKAYWGIEPEQVIDLKALIGDSSDNYPGVPGIGPKTAQDLLGKYKTLDGVYDALKKDGEMKETVAKKLIDGYESAILSRKLATIVTDVPVTLDIEKAKLPDFKTSEKFQTKLKEFGFRSLVQRTGGEWEEKKKKEKVSKDQMELI